MITSCASPQPVRRAVWWRSSSSSAERAVQHSKSVIPTQLSHRSRRLHGFPLEGCKARTPTSPSLTTTKPHASQQVGYSQVSFWATPTPLPKTAPASTFSEERARAHTRFLVEKIKGRQVGAAFWGAVCVSRVCGCAVGRSVVCVLQCRCVQTGRAESERSRITAPDQALPF